jgi:hypothetical protein
MGAPLAHPAEQIFNQVGRGRRPLKGFARLQAHQGERLFEPPPAAKRPRSDGCAPGRGLDSQGRAGRLIALRIRSAHPFRQRVGHVALLMLAAALDERARTEGVGDRLAQRLGSVGHEQQTTRGGKPPFDQILWSNPRELRKGLVQG